MDDGTPALTDPAPPPMQQAGQARFIDYGQGIYLIDALYHRPGVVAFYLLVEGGRAAIIDTGTTRSVPCLLDLLRHLGLTPEQVDYVIPTHVHLDHAGGTGALLARCPQARAVLHPKGARHLIDPARLLAGVREVYGEALARQSFGEITPVDPARVVEAPDGLSLALNGRRLVFLDTPGHARHHFCVEDPASRSLFTGDTFGVSYRVFDGPRGAFIFPTTTPVQFEPAPLHASINRLMARRYGDDGENDGGDEGPAQVFLTHFGRVTELARLARDLHDQIGEVVEIAEAARAAGGERHQRIVEGLKAMLWRRAEAQGCPLDEARFHAWLAGDYELNAQGLGVWLDRAPA